MILINQNALPNCQVLDGIVEQGLRMVIGKYLHLPFALFFEKDVSS